jgi:hypothetical protein
LHIIIGFELLTAVVMRSSIFWHITICSPLKAHRRFRGICLVHLQDRRIGQARNQHKARDKLNYSSRSKNNPSKENRLNQLANCFAIISFFGLFFDGDDGGYMFLRNIVRLSQGQRERELFIAIFVRISNQKILNFILFRKILLCF